MGQSGVQQVRAEAVDDVPHRIPRRGEVLARVGHRGELGRQPRRFRRLVEAFPDRVLFGTDAFPLSPEQLEVYLRFLETDDECFDYAPGEEVPPQGRWQISGADLPGHLLPALYAGNARRVLGLDRG